MSVIARSHTRWSDDVQHGFGVQGTQGLQKAVSKRLSLDTEGGMGSPEPEELSAFTIEDDIQMRVCKGSPWHHSMLPVVSSPVRGHFARAAWLLYWQVCAGVLLQKAETWKAACEPDEVELLVAECASGQDMASVREPQTQV